MLLRLENLSGQEENGTKLSDGLIALSEDSYGQPTDQFETDYRLARRHKEDIVEMNTELFEAADISAEAAEKMKTKDEFLKALVGGMNTMF